MPTDDMTAPLAPTARTPAEFATAIASLPANDATSARTRQLWADWLADYNTPGHYDRKSTGNDARFAYNHIQNPEALLWLAEAAGVAALATQAARDEAGAERTLSAQAAAVRRNVPWSLVESLLWGGSSAG